MTQSASAAARRTLKFKLISAMLVLAIVAIAAELAARRVGPTLPSLRHQDIMQSHPTRLWTMSSGVQQNAGTIANIHPSGFRGAVPEGSRHPGEQRVLVLGDSSFFGHGVSDSNTLAVKLEVQLNSEGQNITVINGAMLGYSTEQAQLLMDEQGWALEPSLLLIGLLWSDNTWDAFADADLMRTTRAFSGSPWANSSFYRLLAGLLDRARGGTGAHIATWTKNSEWPTQGVRRVGVRRYAENLDKLVREAARRGVSVAFIAPANRDTVSLTPKAKDFSWDIYFEAMKQVASHHDLPVVWVSTVLNKSLKTHGLDALFIDKMHPTPLSNALIAGAVHAALGERNWPKSAIHGRAEHPTNLGDFIAKEPQSREVKTRHLSPQRRLFPR